ncbi:unnamed protein product [Durusdinium trenchii]|uniref:Protein kinase domain-containing protein n=2 Tax=Durusdinium trenchii TaxID=1381693 RepID=A0ABP0JD13_9DINO
MSSENAPSTEFIDWLVKLNLSKYHNAACDWWVANGAISLAEVIENWEVFVVDLGLKPLERKRVEKDVESTWRTTLRFNHRLSQEVSDWLQSLSLGHYTAALLEWCEENGASTMEEVWGSWKDVVDKLDIKPLERKRIEKDLASRAVAPLVDEPMPPPMPKMVTRASPQTCTFGPPEDPHMYKLMEEIGFGVTSKVYRCCRGKEIFAVKVISLKRFRHQPCANHITDRLHQEITILLQLKHQHIVKLVDFVKEEDCLYLVMELVTGGELGEWIVKKGAFSELMGRHVFQQIVEGLAYIHSKNIIHRDLKPDNILVDEASKSTPEKLEIKLADFGHSRLINDGSHRRLTARIGTAMYWAPEVSDPNLAAMGYDQTADLWSLGVVLYVMLIGFFPFENGDNLGDRLQADVNNLTFRQRSSGPELSLDAQDLLRSLLAIDPHKRLPLKQCLSHRWCSGRVDVRIMKLATDPGPNAVEVRVPLIVKPGPEKLELLRCDLQKWMYKFRNFAQILPDAVIANLGESSQADLPENKAARRELQHIVERHCGRGMIVVNDQKMWTAIAESKNETMRCPVALKPKEPPAPEVAKRRAEGQEGPPQPEGFATEAPRDGGELNDERSSNEMEGARLAVAALQGAWESQRNSSETYVVQGLDVARHQRQSNGTVTKRPYSLRWNPSKRCLEWGSGKYFLQAPAAVPMVEAVWLASDGGPGFAWRRTKGDLPVRGGKGKGAKGKSKGSFGGGEEGRGERGRGSSRY